jgi:carboxyl-terminal processing protease
MKRKVISLMMCMFISVAFLLTSCSGGRGANTVANPMDGFTAPDPADYSAIAWTEAFKAAHAKLSLEYAFSAWKGVDWPGLYGRFLPRIEQAQAAHDERAYYLALHEYICSIPDGHVSLSANDPTTVTSLCQELVGGGYGLAVAELDDWRVVAAAVVSDSPAAQAGIAPGAEIVTWGELPVRMAIGRIDLGAIPYRTLTGEYSPSSEVSKATSEHFRLEQTRLLTRGPVGARIRVVFKNPGSVNTQTATLTAVDDGGRTFSLLNFAVRPDFSDKVDYRILPEGYGYILLRAEVDLTDMALYPTRIFQQFQEAIASFVAAGAPGVILDLRGNYGGSDELAADLCGFFYSSQRFYEYQEMYDKRNNTFPRLGGIFIAPQTPHYGGPVVVLVNPGTKSSGEGPAAYLSQLPNGSVIGFHGTNGSFGMAGGEISMPGGYTIKYPFGRSVDQYGVVQLDSRNGIGGVRPTYLVPKTLENVLALAAGTDVELQYAVRYLKEMAP